MKVKRWKESGPQSLSKLQKTKSGATCELLQSILIDDAVITMSRVLISVDTASQDHLVPMICLMTCLISVTLDNPTHCMLSFQRKVFHRPHCSKAVLGTEKGVLDARLIFTVHSRRMPRPLYDNSNRKTWGEILHLSILPQLGFLRK